MSDTRAFDLARAAVGDRVQHEFLVLERHEKRLPNGDPFVVLTLGNASGRMATAPVWVNQSDWVAGAEAGRVVQVIGDVASFRNRRQLRLTGPLRVLPAELVQPELFLPRIPVATEQLWDWVDRARADLRSPALRRAVDLFFADDAFRVEFERAPGSADGHHALVGGLLLHVTEVATIGRNSARVMKANADVVVAGALLHDIGKSQAFATTPMGFEYTSVGRLIGPSTLGALMLHERLSTVPPNDLSTSQRSELHHMILAAADGGLGERVAPMTVEAEIVRLANLSSARVNEFAELLADDSRVGDGEFSDTISSGHGRLWRRPHAWE